LVIKGESGAEVVKVLYKTEVMEEACCCHEESIDGQQVAVMVSIVPVVEQGPEELDEIHLSSKALRIPAGYEESGLYYVFMLDRIDDN